MRFSSENDGGHAESPAFCSGTSKLSPPRVASALQGRPSAASLHVCGLAEATARQPGLAKDELQRDLEEEGVGQRRSQSKRLALGVCQV